VLTGFRMHESRRDRNQESSQKPDF